MGEDQIANMMMNHSTEWTEDESPENGTTDVVAFDKSAVECISNCIESLHVEHRMAAYQGPVSIVPVSLYPFKLSIRTHQVYFRDFGSVAAVGAH